MSVTVGTNGAAGTVTLSNGGVLRINGEGLFSSGSGGILNIGAGAAPGVLNAASVSSSSGTPALNFNHTSAGYFFTRDGTATGTAIPILNATRLNHVGSGRTVLLSNNSHSGGTTISAGTLQLGNGGTSGSISGDIVNNAALVVNRSDAVTYSSVVSGTGSLTKSGAGTLTLSGANTYTGGTTINAGTLALGASNVLPDAGAVTLTGGTLDIGANSDTIGALTVSGFNIVGTSGVLTAASFAFNSNSSLLVSANLAGTGALTKAGSGTVVLSGTNTYSGGTTVSAGALRGTTASLQGDIANNASVIFSQGESGTYAGVMSGTGSVTIRGGNVTFSAANTYSGGTTLSSGRLVFANGANLGSGNLTLDGGGLQWAAGNTLDISNRLNALGSAGGVLDTNGNNVTFATALSGGGGLNKTGAGTLTLSGANTYTGSTVVSAGTLFVSGSLAAGTTVTVAPGATLDGIGTINGNVLLRPGATLGSGLTVAGTVSTLAEGALVVVPNTTAGTAMVHSVNTDGTLTLVGSVGVPTNPLYSAVRGDQAFAYVTNNNNGTVSVLDLKMLTVTQTLPVVASGTGPSAYGVTVSADGTRVYVSARNTLNEVVNVFSANATTGQLTFVTSINAGDNPRGLALNPDGSRLYVVNQITGAGTLTVVNTSTNAIVATIPVGDQPVNVALNPAGTRAYVTNFTSHNVSVIDTATNTVVATVATGFGPYGVIVSPDGNFYYVANQSGSSVSQFSAATDTAVAAALAVSAPQGVAVSADGAFLYAGALGLDGIAMFTIDAGTGVLTANGTIGVGGDPSTLSVATNGDALLATGRTFLATTSGSLASTGTTAAFTGGTLLVSGTNLSFATPMSLGAGGGTINTNGNSATVSAVISGTGALTKTGAGTLTLSAANTYSGLTTVSAGTLRLSGAGTLGSGGLSVAAGASVDLNGVNLALASLSGSADVALGSGTLTVGSDNTSTTYSGVISGTGGLIKVGTGTLTLTGANTYGGTTTVSAGTLRVNGSTANNSTVVIQTGATIAGTGTIGSSMPVADNAFIAPGSGGIGTLSVGGSALTWHGSTTGAATALFELSNTDNTSDRLALTSVPGAFNKGTGSTFRFDFGGTGAAGNTYTLATFASTTFSAADFSFTNLAPGVGGSFSIVGGNTLVFVTAVAPVITSPVSASGTYRSAFTYSITATGTTPLTYSVTGALPTGVTLDTSTGVISGTPTQSGTFPVTLTATNAAGPDTESLTITIARATVTPVFTASNKAFDGTTTATIATRSLTGVLGGDNVTLTGGTATFATATAGTGKTVTGTGFTLGGTAAGNYQLSSTSATTTADITAGTLTIEVSNVDFVYDGAPKSPSVITTPAGTPVVVNYGGTTSAPVNAGTYTVSVRSADPNYTGSTARGFTIAKAPAEVTLGGLAQTVTGTPRSASATTSPAGLAVRFTYDGSTTAPSAAGSYTVVATIDDPNYTGSATGTLVLTGTGPTISQQPASRTASSGTTVSLAVTANANGGGTLRYQWQLNGAPIAGATAATLTLEAVRMAQAGAYRVVVSNDAGSVTSSTATLTVQPGNYAGTYFGTLGGTQGQFAMTIRPDGTGTLLLYVVSTKAGYTVVLAIDGDGIFTGVAIPLVRIAAATTIADRPVAAADGDPIVTGRIVNGNITGSTGSLGLAMVGPVDVGPFPFGGSFTASTSGSAPTAIHLVVGTGGRSFALISGGGVTSLGSGTVTTGGGFTIATTDGPSISGSITADGAISGTVTRGNVTTPFTGVIDGPGAIRRLGNLATRGFGGAADNVMIAGFAIGGTSSKQVLVRGVGPGLAAFGVSGVLTQPSLELFLGGTRIAQNTGWGTAANATEIAAAAAANGAFPFAANSADSAILTTLQPGSYTAIVRGANNATGISLVEVYEIGAAGPAGLVNLATRGSVGTGGSQLIAGLVVTGNAPKQLLVRAVGPTLAGFGVSGVLADPQFQIMQGTTVVAANDNWGGDVAAVVAGGLQTVAADVGAFALPAGSRDAALLVTLHPGSYTVLVSGVGGTSGVALVEVYEVP